MKSDYSILVGNDVNNINNTQSWEELLKTIIKHLDINNLIDTNNLRSKPFPFLYEEIYLKSLKKNNASEIELKEFIAQQTKEINHNAIHERIMSLEINDIMTTNYEYALQRSKGFEYDKLENFGFKKEKKYNIYRHNVVNKSRIWHIHGECNTAESITLGYEHYCGQLQRMRQYVVSGKDLDNEKIGGGKARKNKLGIDEYSWLNLFFTKDIHIVGLSLDTVEIDLWWLLTYRARQVLQQNGEQETINNSIKYYYPSSYEVKSKEKLELLKANQVETISVTAKSKEEYYNKIIDIIERND
ncbi:hypothetical protein [Parasediminibacterium sp. JCM 36343]|uniref:hypothetical protein n=1 Tax=Parasediminibacterium sp. JCM 36343 TaxID=3374279 RepID=UPI00397B1225